eukprot:TRINITY_DN40774_c0_g1_i1.p1 TRINITY_DN40774_c0_g1~~TRINITY_DN40774_c0_g1_i1.p1  ORF type:complete len:313 (-),score=55.41 TRINITY_DN40774_c0_g1_i1:38-976(-)
MEEARKPDAPASVTTEGAPPPVKEGNFTDEPQQLIGDVLERVAGIPGISYQVPANIYGSAAMCGVLWKLDSLQAWIATCGQSYFRLSLNYVLQTVLLIAVAQLVNWNEDALDEAIAAGPGGDGCYALSGWFFWTALTLYFMAVLTEMEETFDLGHIIIQGHQTVEKFTHLSYVDKDGTLTLSGGGMTRARKTVLVLCVVLPKFAIGIAMLYFGGRFLASSGSNTDLLMNSLAVNFVQDVDEQIYALLVPPRVKRVIESLPTYDYPGHPRGEVFLPLGKVILCLLIVLIFWLTRLECPNNPCEGAIRPCPLMN